MKASAEVSWICTLTSNENALIGQSLRVVIGVRVCVGEKAYNTSTQKAEAEGHSKLTGGETLHTPTQNKTQKMHTYKINIWAYLKGEVSYYLAISIKIYFQNN